MRWDSLRLDEPAGTGTGDLFSAAGQGAVPGNGTLPLIERGAVARTFDTPGFRGMTFYEVQARSVVNRVPEASRMPFRWTVNPYRGCQHACVYCLGGETPVLMADGRARPLAEVRAGDGVYGTVRRGGRRVYVRSTVLALWSTVKAAYRVVLADGPQRVCSGDHHHRDEQDREQRADDARPGRAQDAGRPGTPECRQAGGQPRIISHEPPLDLGERTLLVRRQRHSQPPRRVPGGYPLTISQETVFIQLFCLCTLSVFMLTA